MTSPNSAVWSVFRRKTKPASSLNIAKVDALEDQRQLGGIYLHVRRSFRDRLCKMKTPSRQTLRNHAVARTIPEQDAALVATLVEEHKEMPTERVLSEHRRHLRTDPVEALAAVQG